MTLLHRLRSMLAWVLRRDEHEQYLDEELQAYVAIAAEAKVRDGVPPAEARRLALLDLGGVEQAKEHVRRGRHGGWLDEIARDVRYACRMFARTPGFTATIVVTLALGIGTNTAIFSLIDALMLRWLPVRDPHELVQVTLGEAGSRSAPGGESFSYAIARAIDEQRTIFDGAAGFSTMHFEVGEPGALIRTPGALVTGAFYDTLGLSAVAGRLLTRQDDERGAPLAVVISYGYWERQFAKRGDAIGQTLRLNGVPSTIVGVSPPGFVGAHVGSVADITAPVAALPHFSPGMAGLLGPGNFWLRVLARPREGVSVAQATERLNAAWQQVADGVIAPHWAASRRKAMAESVFRLEPGGTGWTFLRETYTKSLFVLMAAVSLVLMIACANVASLLLARASARRREIAVRLAIGAGRGRIVRQFLIESTLLSLIGAAFGLGLAWLTGRLLLTLISSEPGEIVFDLSPNWHVLLFAIGVAVVTGLAFGVAPAVRATATAPSHALKEDARSGRASSRLLPILVSTQVALSLVLLAGAGLFVRTLQNLRQIDPGFNAAGIHLFDVETQRTALPPGLVDELRRLPSVVSAAVATHTPLSGMVWSEPAVPAGQVLPEEDNAHFIAAGPRFFETMEVKLLSGREFADVDTASGPAVAIVNEAYAQRHYPQQNPAGQRLSVRLNGQRRELEIVGLVRNTHSVGLRLQAPPTVYVPYALLSDPFSTTLVIRLRGGLAGPGQEIRTLLQSRLPNLPVEFRPLSMLVASTLVQERVMATLASAFALLALVLACVGLYGLLAYSVAQRTKEIGIRMALGAPASRVVAHVLRGGARLVAIGIAAGLPAAWAVTRLVESMLFGLTPTDPAALGGAIVLLVAAAQAAAWLPARRASRVDPLTALRHD